ncbi:tau 95 subunit of transcription factor TFIIIC [Penicillium angulare]|uniref:tau 95 subunit of transcription factor TFIIIC n=1 Tax=Penicillium angulare TaxID=116970 RepID=UPI00253F6621|nr:tau 95 subunit of transcription factor TFIIIC [Penicillium angulare]KAJ5272420.1 tau 95 subunit of transcription factor TFIIIC [Penicillium angulare]
MAPYREPRTAPSYPIPSRRLVSVEHPAVIRNLDKAVDTLQGNIGIDNILNPLKADTPAKLFLRPEDPMSRPLLSTSNPTNNVLLKVTVPKRTGRKRKTGSDGPFIDAAPEDTAVLQRPTSKDLLRSLQDNPSKYQIEAVGKIQRTHVYRAMPDFVYSTSNSAFTQKFRDHIFPYQLDKMKQFDLDMSKGALTAADIIPPPSLSNEQIPFLYMYRQNPGVKHTVDEAGQIITTNTQQSIKVRTHLISHDVANIPTQPQESLEPFETLDSNLQQTINVIRALFEQRPAWTRRGLRNHLQSEEQQYLLRLAIPYVGYIFRAGPWRDAIVKLGVDPRSSPEYRYYQTFMFRLLPREPEVGRDGGRDGGRGRQSQYNHIDPEGLPAPGAKDTYIFSGKLPMHSDGRIWMACDVTDPLLKNLLFPPDLPEGDLGPHVRDTCEVVSDGWFGNGLLAKVKIIMRMKIASLMDGIQPLDEDYRDVAGFPNYAENEADVITHFQLDPRKSSQKEIAMATEIRAAIRSVPLWRKKTEKDKQGEERTKDKNVKGKAKKEAAKSKKRKAVEFADEEYGEDLNHSEGEEEEMERAEMAAAALAARDAAEEDVNDGQNQEDYDEDEDYE